MKSALEKMTNSPDDQSRRNVLQKMGASALALSTLGAGAAAGRRTKEEPADNSQTGDQEGSDKEVKAQVLKGGTISFGDYSLGVGDTTVMKGKWDMQSLAPFNTYQLDVLIDAEKVYRPTLRSTNIDLNDIEKQWEYYPNSPMGPAWHLKAVIVTTTGPFGNQVTMESEVKTFDTGRCEARLGTMWPLKDWAYAVATIE